MRIFINSEKLVLDVNQLSTEEVLQCAGYEVSNKYSVLDEITNQVYYIGDIISLRNNTSLMIKIN